MKHKNAYHEDTSSLSHKVYLCLRVFVPSWLNIVARELRRRVGQTLLLLLLAGFFAYRYTISLHPVYSVVMTGLVVVALLNLYGSPRFRWSGLAINLGISALFLDLVFAQVAIAELMKAMAMANYWMLIPAGLMVVLSLAVRSWRWRWLLAQVGDLPFGPLFSSTAIGVAGNMVLPARAGEFLRAYVLARQAPVSATTAFASIVVERILDGLSILTSLLLVMVLARIESPELRAMGYAGALFYLGAIIVILVFYLRQAWVERLVMVVLPSGLAVKVKELMASFAEGLHVLRNVRQLIMVVALSALTWLVIAYSMWPMIIAFNFGAAPPFFLPFLLIGTLALGLMIPAAPGGLGIFQYAAVLTLQLAFPRAVVQQAGFIETAAAFSVALHVAQAIPEILVGLWCFLRMNMTLSQLQQQYAEQGVEMPLPE
jgi:uncharacterized protein (TIRG00374 family)